MKKIVKFAASLLVFAGALASCKKEAMTQELVSNAPTSFTAQLESTKLTIDGFTPKFEIGDVLNVIAQNNAAASFEVSKLSASGEATLNIKGSWSATPVAPFFIYNGTTKIALPSNNMLAFDAPNNVLSAEPNSLGLATVVAKTDNLNNVTMLNASCLLKIVVPEGVKALKIAPGSGSITSMGSINFTNGTIVVGAMSTTPTQVAFTGNNGAGLSAGTYYVPLFPQTFNGGVRVGVSTDGSAYQWKEKTGDFIFQRSKIYDMGDIADWFAPEPKFTVEDAIAEYEGSFKFGMYYMGVMQGPQTESGEIKIEASDNESNGNVKFTKFNGNDCSIYGMFDLVSGTITVAPGAKITTVSYQDRTFDRSVEFFIDEATKQNLSCAPATIICAAAPDSPISFAIDEMAYTKKAPAPTGPTVADFVGKYKGGLKEQTYMYGNSAGPQQDRTEESAHQEFEFKAETNGTNNVVMTKYFGNACNVPGYFDTETCEATFAAGAVITFIQGAGATSTPLVLKLSEDFNVLTQVGTMSGNSNPPFPFTFEVTEISMKKQGGAAVSFELSDVFKYGWVVTYKANGVAKAETSGNNTTFASQAGTPAEASTGCNLQITYFMCGYNSGYANFDLTTGTLTIPQAKNSGVLYFPAIDWTGKYLSSDIVMKMSEDKKTIVATGSFQLTDGTTISDYTLTRQ